jgi:hypothetical protein
VIAIPKKGDKVFVSLKTDIWYGLDLHRCFGLSEAYIRGFKHSADTLIRSIRRSKKAAADERIIPACQLYRHYIELHLKYILLHGRRLKHITFTDKQVRTHDLQKLWKMTRSLILAILPEEPVDDLDVMESLINEFHQIDPDGQELRFDRRTDKTQSLKQMPAAFGLKTLQSVMVTIDYYLHQIAICFLAEIDELNANFV